MKMKRELAGFRIEARLLKRMENVAVRRKCSTRSVLELALEEALPRLEREAGLAPGGPVALALKQELDRRLEQRRKKRR